MEVMPNWTLSGKKKKSAKKKRKRRLQHVCKDDGEQAPLCPILGQLHRTSATEAPA
jgi:ribosomal protein L32